jgi:hypothetical protein
MLGGFPVCAARRHRHTQRNLVSGKCLDVRDGVNADGAVVQQWDCTETNGMYWRPPGVEEYDQGQVRSRIGLKCLDVRGGSLDDWAVIQIYHCTSNNYAQIWTIRI